MSLWLIGYDAVTDELAHEFEVPVAMVEAAKGVLKPPMNIEVFAYNVILTKRSSEEIAKLLGVTIDNDANDYFLQEFEDENGADTANSR